MWAIEIIKHDNKANLLTVGSCAKPEIASNEVLIKTIAAGVNRADIFQKNGLYPPPPGSSDILGLEVAGTIAQIGKDVTGFNVGDRVCALLEGGGYAEYAAAPATQTLHLPENLDFIQGASLPEALFTAYSNLFDHAHMKPGESLLMHGGTSGLGTFTMQIATAFGINCYSTAKSDEKCIFLESLGAKNAINYKTHNFVEEIQSLTNGEGVNCIIDIVGGDYFNKNLKALANNGRLVCLSFLNGAKIEANLAPLLFKNLTITGTTLRNKSLLYKEKIANSLHKEIWPLLANNTIRPVIDSVFSFSEANNAHKLMEDSGHIGKIILKCD